MLVPPNLQMAIDSGRWPVLIRTVAVLSTSQLWNGPKNDSCQRLNNLFVRTFADAR